MVLVAVISKKKKKFLNFKNYRNMVKRSLGSVTEVEVYVLTY